MPDYYKYLPVSAGDEHWGLSVLNAGSTHIQPGMSYPSPGHPSHHNFKWSKGRVLQEHQVIYITRGEGVFESERSGRREVKEGTILLLFPGERHRYKPDRQTGWDEYWVGFAGPVAERIFQRHFFQPEDPTLVLGCHEGLLHLFLEIIDTTKKEATGYQPLAAGAVLHILGRIYHLSQQEKFEGQGIAPLIDQARLLFRSCRRPYLSGRCRTGAEDQLFPL